MNGRLLAAQIVAASAVATASAAARVSPVLAAITNNTFAPIGELQPGGHVATVGLILGCEATDSFTVRVTVRRGDAVATGRQHGRCTGHAETHAVTVTTSNGQPLDAGTAEICGEAATHRPGSVDDTRAWCRAGGVTLGTRRP